jgi:hypothetical protein
MIPDLERLVISYLDPHSFKVIIQWKPRYIIDFQKIKDQYKLRIPEIMKDRIIETGVILKTSLTILYSESMEIPDSQKYQIYSKIKMLIKDWTQFRMEELISEYKIVDEEYFSNYSFCFENSVYFNYIFKSESAPNSMRIHRDLICTKVEFDDAKEIKEIFIILKKLRDIVKEHDILAIEHIKTYIQSLAIFQKKTNNITYLYALLQEIEQEIKLQNIEVFEKLKLDFESGELSHIILEFDNSNLFHKSQKFLKLKFFDFTDSDQDLNIIKINGEDVKIDILPPIFKSIYNIIEITNKFLILYRYYKTT